MSRLPRPSALGALGVLAALALVFVVAARSAPVEARGALLPWFGAYEVEQVRLLGQAVYVDTSSGVADLGTVIALGLIAGLLLAGGVVARGDARRPLLVAGFGAAYLGLDDLLAIHETLGHNLGGLAQLPVVDHPDDVIIGVYGLLVLAFGIRHRRLLRRAPRTPWAIAFALGGTAVLLDLSPFGYRALEEGLEVLTGVALLVGTALTVRAIASDHQQDQAAERRAAAPGAPAHA